MNQNNYDKQLFRLRKYYNTLRYFLGIHFGGYEVSTNDEVNRIYLQLCIVIEEILEDDSFKKLRKKTWKVFDNLMNPENDIDWDMDGKQKCNEFSSAVEVLFIRNGKKIYELDSDDIKILEPIEKFSKGYESEKLHRAIDKAMPILYPIAKVAEFLSPKDNTQKEKIGATSDFLIEKFEKLLIQLRSIPLSGGLKNDLKLLDVSKKVRNLLRQGFVNGEQRANDFTREGGNYYSKITKQVDSEITNETQASNAIFLQQWGWHDIKIRELLDEVRLIKEIKDSKTKSEKREKFYTPKDEYDAYKDIKQILQTAKNEVFIVDPWVDESLFELYIEKIPNNVIIKILTKNPSSNFITVGKKLQKKLSIQIATNSALHDRHIFVDGRAWQLGSSLKDIAKSKPSTMIEVETTKKEVYDFYIQYFNQGNRVI